MAGEVLMCVWETAWSLKSRGASVSKDILNNILVECNCKGLVSFTEKGFEDTFPHSKVQFADFKRYAMLSLKPLAVNQIQFEDHMERCCLKLALSSSGYKGFSTGQNQFEQIWHIFVRIAHAGSYPPVVSADNVNWVLDGTVDIKSESTSNNNGKVENDLTFKEFLKILRKSGDREFIEYMYSWIVREPIKEATVACRHKLADGWSIWDKFKLVMCYGSLEMYSNKDMENPAKVYYVDSKSVGTKVAPGWKVFSASKKLNQRLELFVGDKQTKVLIQLALGSEYEVEEWQQAFQKNVNAMDSGNKPMIQEIQRRPSDPNIGKRNFKLNHAKVEKPDQGPVLNQEEITEKVRSVFLGVDKDGNGLMNKEEFRTMIHILEVDIDDEQLDLVFGIIDMDGSGEVAFEEFFRYMMMVVGLNVASSNHEDDDMHIVKAFRKADRESRGVMEFKEFIEFLVSADQTDLIAPAITMFQECDSDGNGCLEYEQFRDIFLLLGINQTELVSEEEKKAQRLLKEGLRKICRTADTGKVAAYLEERWKMFAGFKRYDEHENLVMTGSELVKDYLPGSYKMSELAFFDPPAVLPKHVVEIQGASWRTKNEGEKHGELTFTGEFDGVVPTVLATTESLSYYNCAFASQSDCEYKLVYRHGVIDFDYSQKYLEDYVLQGAGGSGIEKHAFDHLDCPLGDDSGVMVIGKYVNEDTLHLTGFLVPKMHTVFVPANTIHSNDYLRGTWRTMLSDETDIDHVQFVRYEGGEKQKFHFTFNEV